MAVIFAWQIVEIVNEALPIPKPGPFVWTLPRVHWDPLGRREESKAVN
jgi:hypothetical protein